MNVAKNWALTIMLTALRFVRFSSKLLLKEQMIIPAKKTLNDAFHIHTKLINISEICQKISREIGCFLLIVSWRSFPLKSADFSTNFDFFPTTIPRNQPIFHEFATENPAKFCFFFREISEALYIHFIEEQ